MNAERSQPHGQSALATLRAQRRTVAGAILMLVLPGGVLFASAGRLDWGMAWAYILLTWFAFIGSRILIWRRNPDLLVERSQALDKDDTKGWDKVLVPLVALWGPAVVQLIAGLNLRFSWPPSMPLGLQWAGLLVLVLGYLLSVWASVENRFFSAAVRIQTERGHTVVSSGPYRFVRHPGYCGGLLSGLAAPFMLGSGWALFPALLVALALIIRTALEDRTLHQELAGYREYAARVRYRLLPGLW